MKLGATILAVAALLGSSPGGAWSQMKARVAWTSFASNMSGTWVAQEEGFFKKNGLEVELVHIPSTSRVIQVMLAGELHYSYMDGRNSVTAALQGADVVILAGVANRLETIIAELAPTEPKARTAKPDDFLDTRFVSQLEKEGFFKAGIPR